MNGWSWSIRCAGVARHVIEAEAARMATDVATDDEVGVVHASEPTAVAELGVRQGAFSAAEVAKRLGGLVWFRRDAVEDREIDVRALYFAGELVFEVACCELLDSDELEVGPSLIAEVEPTLADLLEPRTWIMRLAAERFGDDFARISSPYGLDADEARTIPGTGPDRSPDVSPGGTADDDLPF